MAEVAAANQEATDALEWPATASSTSAAAADTVGEQLPIAGFSALA